MPAADATHWTDCLSGRPNVTWWEQLGPRGARSVLGLDIAANFLTPPADLDVTLAAGDLSDLGSLPSVQGRTFDKVLFLQSLRYAIDQVATLRAARSLLRDDGVLIISRAHPIRFAVKRSERDNIGLGDAYHTTAPYSYRSGWNAEVSLTHATDTFSSMVNSLVTAGFWIEEISEPKLSEEQKESSPRSRPGLPDTWASSSSGPAPTLVSASSAACPSPLAKAWRKILVS
jgi:SAM-dependent methyltransferase